MKPRIKYKAIALATILLGGCASYNFQEMFPAYYEEGQASPEGLIHQDRVPSELVDALPVDFQLAQYTGHLWCFRDNGGKTLFGEPWRSIQRNRWSDEFTEKLKSASDDDQYKVFTPSGYPQIFCVMPNVDTEQLFDETWFGSWLTYLSSWELSEIENESLIESNKKLAIRISDTQKIISQVNDSINAYDQKIKDTEKSITEIEALIGQRKSKLGMKILGLDINSTRDLPPFDPKVPYDKNKDPFLGVVKDGTEDVSKRSWATDQMSGGKYLDPELAKKIDDANRFFSNPENIADANLKQDIVALKNDGFHGIAVTSGARSPWRQAELYANAKKNGNPVGKYVRSDHMFGQAGDMSIPAGWQWNSPSHQKLRSVMSRLGLEMRVPNDPVHFTLASPSRSFYARRLAMVRAYMAKASQIKAAQGAVRENAIFDQTSLVEQKAKVEADLQARNVELTKRTDLFARISAVYLSKRSELQQLDAEISRREDEARRRAEREARRDREPREPRWPRDFNRPEPSPPKVDRPEPPHREPPRRDPPSRERPGNDGGSVRMPRLG